jgi:hypothetical protein
MTRHYNLALSVGITVAALIASVGLGVWTGLAARLSPTAFSPPGSIEP